MLRVKIALDEAKRGFVIGDVILRATFADGTVVDGTTLTGGEFAGVLMNKAGVYEVTVLSQGGVNGARAMHGALRRDIPFLPRDIA